MFRFYRKYVKPRERLVFIILVSVIALSFGITGAMITVVGQKPEEYLAGRVWGRDVSINEFDSLRRRMSTTTRLLARDEGRRQMWQRLIEIDEAQRLGLVVTDAELRNWFQVNVPGTDLGIDTRRLRQQAQQFNLTLGELEEARREQILLEKYYILTSASQKVSLQEIFDQYRTAYQRTKCRYVVFSQERQGSPSGFRGIGKPPAVREAVAKEYGRSRRRPESSARVRVEYAYADLKALAGQQPEPDEQKIVEFYESRKRDLYRIEDPSTRSPDSLAQDHPSPQGGSTPQERFRPLEEVRQEIAQKIRESEALEIAEQKLTNLDRRRKELLVQGKPLKEISLAELARADGLGGAISDWLTERNATELEKVVGKPLQGSLAGIASEVGEQQWSQPIQTDRGMVLLQPIEKIAKQPLSMTQGVRRVFSRRTQRDAAQRAASKAAQSFRDDVRNREEAKVRKLREEKPEPQELERRTATAEADSFEEIAKERKLAVKESPFLQEGEPLAELDLPDARAFLVELHRKGPDKLRLAIGNRAAYCLRLGESAPPTGKDFEEKKEGIRQDLERRKMLGFLRAQQEILWEAARVEDFAEKTKTGASPEPDHPR